MNQYNPNENPMQVNCPFRVDHRHLGMETTYLIQILEMPTQKMQLKSMKSKSTREPYLTDSDDSDEDGETENTPLNRQNDISW